MQITLRKVRVVKSVESHKDELISGDVLSLGRGSDQSIFLSNPRVALEHASLSQIESGKYSLDAIDNNKFKHNGKTTNQTLVDVDDLIEFGGYEIRIKLSHETDLMLEVSEKFSDQTEGLKQSLIDQSAGYIENLLPKKRLFSWAIVIIILLTGFLIPAVQMNKDDTKSEAFHHKLSESRNFFGRECTSCHSRQVEGSSLLPVKSFGDHPQFRVPIGILGNGEYEYIPINEYKGESSLSHITFPHKTHLSKQLDKPGGGAVQLECSNCHSWNHEGEIKRVNFDDNCAECHRPTIPNSDRVTLPHGDLESLVSHVKKYYSSVIVDSTLLEKKEGRRILRRPGQKQPNKPETGSPRSFKEMSDSAIKEIVYYTGCNTCHEIVNESGRDSGISMLVKAVDKIHWYNRAVFNHETHSDNCSDCHDAEFSESSFDLLLPEISTCKSCHDGPFRLTSTAPSDCVTCHQFSSETIISAKYEN